MTITCIDYEIVPEARVADLRRLTQSIERFDIRRPELAITGLPNAEEEYDLNALFDSGTESFVGWLMVRRVRGSKDLDVLCRDEAADRTLELCLCGAPETVETRAILSTAEVLDLVAQLMAGEDLASWGYGPTPIFEAIIRPW